MTIGIDLGDRLHAACVLSAAGDILVETEVINTGECLTTFATRYVRRSSLRQGAPCPP